MNFKEATNEIKSRFAKRRISTFAKRNNVNIDEVEVIDDEPIETLEKEFKRSCGIRTRLYKNLTEEQQKAWLSYYNDHKKLSLKVKEKQNDETTLNDDLNNEMILNKPVSHVKCEKSEKQEKAKKRNTNKSQTINQESALTTNDSKPTETIEQKSERKHHKRKSKNTDSN